VPTGHGGAPTGHGGAPAEGGRAAGAREGAPKRIRRGGGESRQKEKWQIEK
jgi:hypothetical protein